MPGTAAGTQRFSTSTVRRATSSTPAWLALSVPDSTMFGFSNVPSSRTF